MRARLADRLPSSTIAKYYCYQATVSFGFFSPIFTLFLLDRGLDYTAISTLSMLYAVVTVVGEVPTGYVGDRIGRRNSLLASSAFMTLSILGFVVVESFLGLAVLYVLWALMMVFKSGTGDAWLYDTLEAELDGDRFARVRGRGGSVNRAVTVVAMLAGGVLYSVDHALPFLASGVLNGAGVVVLLTLPENRQYVGGNAESDGNDGSDESFTVFDALPVIRRRFSRPPLRSFVAYAALFFGVATVANMYVQPVTTRSLGFPEASLGVLYAAFTAVAAVASYCAGPVGDRFGVRGTLLVAPVLLGLFLLAPLAWPLLAFPAFFAVRGSNALLAPLVSQYVNDRVESVGRATVLSAASMAYALAKLPFYLLAGTVADAISPLVAVGVLGAALVVGVAAVRVVSSSFGASGADVGDDTAGDAPGEDAASR
ncbi:MULTISPECIES: MFS transporter [Halorussus]|uniref:MFS transporter n=1 Tax=Halorussus TaxID=1070314 RepID=UPI00209D9016|nr:MFS transporter [Halorussus vallis]USZ73944.1 MFS transporter [Halorussus vallis]